MIYGYIFVIDTSSQHLRFIHRMSSFVHGKLASSKFDNNTFGFN